MLLFNCTTQRLALYECVCVCVCVTLQSFSLALLELIGVKIPQSHSLVITDASHPCTHTGSRITILFVRLIALLCLSLKKKKSSRGYLSFCVNVQSPMDEIYCLQMEMKLFSPGTLELFWSDVTTDIISQN